MRKEDIFGGRMEPWTFKLLCLVAFIHAASGQSIESIPNGTVVAVGGTIDFTLVRYNLASGNTLIDIVGGFLLPGSNDVKPLSIWNATAGTLVLYPDLAAESPSFEGRVSVPSAKVMRVRNFTFQDQDLRFVFRMTYQDPTTRTKSSQMSVQIIDFHHVTVNTSSNLTGIENQHRLVISCLSSGIPTPSIAWTKDGGPVPAGVQVIYAPSTANYTNTSLLSFATLKREDRGVYMCHAQNLADSQSESFTLAVKSAPEKTTLTLTCEQHSEKICWSSPSDTDDSKATSYSVTLGNGLNQSFPSTACVPNAWLSNVTYPFNVSVVASNQYGSSPPIEKTILNDNFCSGAAHLAAKSGMTMLLLLCTVMPLISY